MSYIYSTYYPEEGPDADGAIKTISLWQPWASLIMLGIKTYETRGWKIHYRGQLAIHATKTIIPFGRIFYDVDQEDRDYIMRSIEAAYGSYKDMPTGAVIGTVNITDCIKTTEAIRSISRIERICGDYRPGRFAWQLEDIHPFRAPLPVAGHQGLWDWRPKFV